MEQFVKISTYLVEWSHRDGYKAPTYYVEVQREYREADTIREAVKKAKERSRLADFPGIWYCKLTDVTSVLSRRKKKK